ELTSSLDHRPKAQALCVFPLGCGRAPVGAAAPAGLPAVASRAWQDRRNVGDDLRSLNGDFGQFLVGHWLDSLGHSIIVAPGERLERAERVENAEVPEVTNGNHEGAFTAVLTPIVDHPNAKDRVLNIKNIGRRWQCGNVSLEFVDERRQRLVWVTSDGRRSIWSKPGTVVERDEEDHPVSFP
ncbi:unnamed protein product, partial [Cladocopium goreaui]